jgi:hypothetical protein
MSANDLTWSYAEVLKAFYLRNKLSSLSESAEYEAKFLSE